jgi:pre-mRNA-splicing factor ISY1
VYDAQGLEVKGNGGYKYFGAARDLPGVRELFQKERPQIPRKTQAELYREISYEYYGEE